ncbi:hypothetical protein PCE1_001203 [Barthelona sp. PCE]
MHPRAVQCPYCNRAYFKHTIELHMKNCKKILEARGEFRSNELDEEEFLRTAKFGTAKERMDLNTTANQSFSENQLIQCQNCGRRFKEEQLPRHQRSCTKERPFDTKFLHRIGENPAPERPKTSYSPSKRTLPRKRPSTPPRTSSRMHEREEPMENDSVSLADAFKSRLNRKPKKSPRKRTPKANRHEPAQKPSMNTVIDGLSNMPTLEDNGEMDALDHNPKASRTAPITQPITAYNENENEDEDDAYAQTILRTIKRHMKENRQVFPITARFCPYCGEPLDKAHRFCAICGAVRSTS